MKIVKKTVILGAFAMEILYCFIFFIFPGLSELIGPIRIGAIDPTILYHTLFHLVMITIILIGASIKDD